FPRVLGEAHPEFTPEEIEHVNHVSLSDRFVQPQTSGQDVLGFGRDLRVADELLGDVTWLQLEQEEQRREDKQEDRKHPSEPLQDVLDHAAQPPLYQGLAGIFAPSRDSTTGCL